MSIVVTPIPQLIDLTAPAFTLGLASAAGSAVTAVASDSTLLAFDTTLPAAVGTSATGSAVVTARRDHVHAGVTDPIGNNLDLSSHLLVGNGGSTGIAISSVGEVTMAAQPSCVVPADSKTNVTGDGTVYTVVWGTADVDRGGDFDDVSTFTCPVDGLYRFTANPGSSQYASGHTDTRLTVVGANFASELQINGYACRDAGSTLLSIPFTALIDCDADDTVTFTFQVAGGAKTIDLAASPDGSMSVELVI